VWWVSGRFDVGVRSVALLGFEESFSVRHHRFLAISAIAVSG
jgi:hypothetical protein